MCVVGVSHVLGTTVGLMWVDVTHLRGATNPRNRTHQYFGGIHLLRRDLGPPGEQRPARPFVRKYHSGLGHGSIRWRRAQKGVWQHLTF